MNQTFTAILLAGGIGSRMGAEIPKQFLMLKGEPLALYSYNALLTTPLIQEIIVVCEDAYRSLFHQNIKPLHFARPGARRQDSLFNGLKLARSSYICIHDSARPIIRPSLIEEVCLAALETGAAVLGVPSKSTIKMASKQGYVEKTLERDSLWEIQTPQVVKKSILEEGFETIKDSVTDDVSIAERLGVKVKLVRGDYFNIKVTTSEDLDIATLFINQQHAKL